MQDEAQAVAERIQEMERRYRKARNARIRETVFHGLLVLMTLPMLWIGAQYAQQGELSWYLLAAGALAIIVLIYSEILRWRWEIPLEVYLELPLIMVMALSTRQLRKWWLAPHPLLHSKSPRDTWHAGKHEEVRDFIRSALSGDMA